MLNSIDEDHIIKVNDFGQLPGDTIDREREDFRLYTLEDYLKDFKQNDDIEESKEGSKNLGNSEDNSIVNPNSEYDENNNIDGEISFFQRKSTIMTENETVDIMIKVIDLLEILHSKRIIHTNINPGEIYFKNVRDLDSLCMIQ